MPYVTKWETCQAYGGSEEGGWWYDQRIPEWKFGIWLPEFFAYKVCRFLNRREYKRREKENTYGYTDSLSYRDDFYTYGFSDFFRTRHEPEARPHYE